MHAYIPYNIYFREKWENMAEYSASIVQKSYRGYQIRRNNCEIDLDWDINS